MTQHQAPEVTSEQHRDVANELYEFIKANEPHMLADEREFFNDVYSLLLHREASITATAKQREHVAMHLRDEVSRSAALEVLAGIVALADAPAMAQRKLDAVAAELRSIGGSLAAGQSFT